VSSYSGLYSSFTTKGVARWRSPSPASPAAGFGRAMTKSASAGARPQWRPPPSPMQRWEKHGESPKSYIRSLHQPPSAPVDDEPCNPAPALLSNDRKPAAAVVAMVQQLTRSQLESLVITHIDDGSMLVEDVSRLLNLG